MNFSVFGLIMVSLMVASAYAEEGVTSCFVCNSNDDASCDDPYSSKSEHIKQCTNGETFCRKTTQSVLGEISIVRQCAKELYKDDYEGCYKTAGKSTQHVCTCKNEGTSQPCNNAVGAKSSFAAVVLSLAVAKLFF